MSREMLSQVARNPSIPVTILPRLSLLIEDYRARYIAHLQGQLWAPDIYIACFVIVA